MKPISRRTFLGAAGAATWTALQPRFAIGQEGDSPNSKINIAFIGAGGMARAGTKACAQENFVAFCDVDDDRAKDTYLQYPDVPRFKDFRVMLDKMGNQIDAVVISTPDHTHFAAAMDCMQRGIHVLRSKNRWRTIFGRYVRCRKRHTNTV